MSLYVMTNAQRLEHIRDGIAAVHEELEYWLGELKSLDSDRPTSTQGGKADDESTHTARP